MASEVAGHKKTSMDNDISNAMDDDDDDDDRQEKLGEGASKDIVTVPQCF